MYTGLYTIYKYTYRLRLCLLHNRLGLPHVPPPRARDRAGRHAQRVQTSESVCTRSMHTIYVHAQRVQTSESVCASRRRHARRHSGVRHGPGLGVGHMGGGVGGSRGGHGGSPSGPRQCTAASSTSFIGTAPRPGPLGICYSLSLDTPRSLSVSLCLSLCLPPPLCLCLSLSACLPASFALCRSL
jgi:hypothetical protein